MSSHTENVEGVGYKDVDYWLTSTPDSGFNEQLKTFNSLREPTGRLKTYVKFVGTISPTKQNGYGHLNMYSNRITVREILDMKPWDSSIPNGVINHLSKGKISPVKVHSEKINQLLLDWDQMQEQII